MRNNVIAILPTGDYTTVTEIPGGRGTREQFKRMFHRYHFALSFCEGKEILEVACGAGQGLGYLANKARRVVGGDYTEKLVRLAKDHYGDRVDCCLMRLKMVCPNILCLFPSRMIPPTLSIKSSTP